MTVLRARVLTPTGPTGWRYLEDALVVVDDQGRIEAVTPPDGRPVDQDLRPGVLLPGFVDAHIHYPQTRIVGAASGPLLTWLATSTFPEETRFADPAHARAVAERFVTSLAAAGTTLAMVYGPVFPQATEILLQTLQRRGLKAIAGPVLMDEDAPEALLLPPDRALPALADLAERWHGRDGLQVAVIPRFALSCSRAMLQGAGRLAAELDLPVSTHLSENLEECRVARERFGTPDYLAVYEDAGLLRPGAVFAHCVHLSEDEWDRFAAAGAVVAHCPDSNFFLGSGQMPVSPILQRDIALAVGTDLAAGRTFRVPRVLSQAYDNALITGRRVEPARLLWWGTRGGALALGHPGTGAVEVGLDADLVCVDVPPWAETAEQVAASVLFDHDAPRPRFTWVRGRLVWERPPGAWSWGG